jgi:serine/threonine-protein kinase HipA
MTTIFYEAFPVAWMTFESEWRLDCDSSWEARRLAFPISLTMPLRSGVVDADRLLPWLANCFRKHISRKSVSG